MDWSAAVPAFFGAAVGVVASLLSERLRAAITGQLWLAQERWKLKRESYSTLLGLLQKMTRALRLAQTELEPFQASAQVPSEINKRLNHIVEDGFSPAMDAYGEALAVARLWLSEATFQALERASARLDAAAAGPALVVQMLAAFEDARVALLSEARRDMRFRIGASQ